ncbi:MAG: B-box zinc finger protein [Clostridiales bacterium]|nr:B-box zinc finger protein [Clostridiales bacterium]MCF8023751.1 B-box zinc finger protein [Clostridiales bacterium]
MKCINHPDRDAETLCCDCKEPLCSECSYKIGNSTYCYRCLEKTVETVEDNNNNIKNDPNKSRFIAFLLSLMPGLGYMYLGLMKKGLETLILFFGTIFVSSIIHLGELVSFVLPVLFFYSVFDTQNLLSKMKNGIYVADISLLRWEDWGSKNISRNSIIAYGLIGLGVVALLNNVMPFVYHNYILERILPPVIIIGLGVYILYRNKRRGGEKHE